MLCYNHKVTELSVKGYGTVTQYFIKLPVNAVFLSNPFLSLFDVIDLDITWKMLLYIIGHLINQQKG